MANINGLTGTAADVNSNNQLTVNVPTTDTQAGFVTMQTENDPGVATGERYVYSPETSDDYRLRVGVDRIVAQDTFIYGTQDTGRYNYTFTTLTAAQTGGFLTTNATGITTTTTGCRFFTQRLFSINTQQTSTYVEVNAAFAAALSGSTNTTIDVGLFQDGGSNPFAPTDGVYWRFNSSGVYGVLNNNTTETVLGPFSLTDGGAAFIPTIGQTYQFVIAITNREVKFWLDDLLLGKIELQTGASRPFLSESLPFKIRHAIVGGAAGNTQQLKVGSYSVHWGDIERDKPWSAVMAAQGNMAYQGQGGSTMGSTASYGNSANPTSAAGSNTAANITGLGGQGAINAAAGAATDFIATSYQVPAGSTTIPGRALHITGVRISSANLGAAVATTPTCLAWSLAFGHTAVSLATAETGSFVTATTKAPRRIALGFQSIAVGAAIGALYTPDSIYMSFDGGEVVVQPGEFIATVVKQIVGTATASQSIWYHVTFVGYFE